MVRITAHAHHRQEIARSQRVNSGNSFIARAGALLVALPFVDLIIRRRTSAY